MAILEFANDILIDILGNKAYLTDDKLYVMDPYDSTTPVGYVQTNESDLGEPSVDKMINYIYFDYVGRFDITFYNGDVPLATVTAPQTDTRRVGQLYMPLEARKPFQKLKIVIQTKIIGSEMYGMELNFGAMKRRYNG